MNPFILAADTAVTPEVTSLLSDDLVKTFSDGLATIGSDVVKFIVVALPVGLAIFGLFKAIRLGFNFFNTIAN